MQIYTEFRRVKFKVYIDGKLFTEACHCRETRWHVTVKGVMMTVGVYQHASSFSLQ